MSNFRPACFIALLIFCSNICGQETAETRKEIWPEIDLFFPLNERFRLVVAAGSEKASETREGLEAQAGAYVDCFFRDRITLRAGYRYGFALGDNEPFSEHRVVLDQTFHKPLQRKFVFSDRNRQELRWINGDFSLRFRNRAKLERAFVIGKRSLVPYGSGELFYDSRFSTFNRFRLTIGTQLVFAKRETWLMNIRRQRILDVYYLWQTDSRSQPKRLHAIGVTFEIHF